MQLADDVSRRSRRFSGLSLAFLVSVLLLTGIGLATVHSASAEMAQDFLPRQALWVGVGALLFLIAFSLDYHVIVDVSPVFYVFALVLLGVTLMVGTGPGGVKSWLAIGSFRIGQPAELAKMAAIIFLARYLSTAEKQFLGFVQILLAVLIVAVPMVLVALQPDMGSAAMFAPMLMGMLLVAGIRLRWILIAVGLVAALGFGVWNFGMAPYQHQRVLTFLQPENDPLGAGYQLKQSQIAVGSGELLGRGYMQGTQSQLRFIPELHTDFIFAVLAEEWGFLGVTATLLLYAIFILSALGIAMRARDRAGILLVVGFVSVFTFHVLYNTAMVVGMLPITGIPLPFLSYGGSFILLMLFGAGLVLNVDVRRHVNR